jgi:hypothetical protein
MKADTKEADNIYNYYIKLEDVMTKYIEIKHNKILEENKKIVEEKDKLLQIKDDETKKIVEEKDKLLQIKDEENKKIIEENKKKDEVINNIKQLTYEEADKIGSIYLLSTDKPNITKCGRTKSILKRKTALQTSQVDDIQVIYEYKTSDDVLLESIVHKILSRYRLNREHFMCNVDYMKLIINTAGSVLDILNSSFEYITKEELYKKIYNKLELNNIEYNEDIDDDINDNSNIINDLELVQNFQDIDDDINDDSNIINDLELVQNFQDIDNKEFKDYLKDNNKEDIKYININNILKYFNLIDVDNDILEEYNNIIINKCNIETHNNIILILQNKEYIKYLLEIFSEENLNKKKIIKIMRNKLTKILCLRELESYYNINILDIESLRINNFKQMNIELFNNIKNTFDLQRGNPSDWNDFNKLYVKLIRTMSCNNIIISKKFKTKVDRDKIIYFINDKLIQQHINLHKYKKNYLDSFLDDIINKYDLS